MTNSRSRAIRKIRRWLEYLFLTVGILAVGIFIWSIASQAVYQDWGNWAFDQQMQGRRATVWGYLNARKDQLLARSGKPPAAPSIATPPTPPAPSVPRPVPPAENSLIARLSIPRLQLTAMVREGVGEGTLRVALGHIPGTAMPGQDGNVGVAGHRDRIFRGLRQIRKNDVIDLETPTGNYSYQVDSTSIVKPQDVSVLQAADHPELTLVTCYPFYYIGAAPDRFIVKARQLTGQPSAANPPLLHAAVTSPNPPAPTIRPKPQPKPKPLAPHDGRRVDFEVRKGSSRQLTPGISLGLTWADPYTHEVSGWMWVMPDRRTIWLRSQSSRQPVVFYGREDGRKRELHITHVNANSISGYLLLPEPYRAAAVNRIYARR